MPLRTSRWTSHLDQSHSPTWSSTNSRGECPLLGVIWTSTIAGPPSIWNHTPTSQSIALVKQATNHQTRCHQARWQGESLCTFQQQVQIRQVWDWAAPNEDVSPPVSTSMQTSYLRGNPTYLIMRRSRRLPKRILRKLHSRSLSLEKGQTKDSSTTEVNCRTLRVVLVGSWSREARAFWKQMSLCQLCRTSRVSIPISKILFTFAHSRVWTMKTHRWAAAKKTVAAQLFALARTRLQTHS